MRRSIAATTILGLLFVAVPAAAQNGTLEEIERLAGAGRLTDARAALDQWGRENPATTNLPGEVRARAQLLQARLAVDPAAAEAGYLAVALGYPTTPSAPEALLRLGQGMVAAAQAGVAGRAARAAGYLERLVSDYPGSPERAVGLLWLVRAHSLAGRADRACATARNAISIGVGAPDVEELIRLEYSEACDDDVDLHARPASGRPPPSARGSRP